MENDDNSDKAEYDAQLRQLRMGRLITKVTSKAEYDVQLRRLRMGRSITKVTSAPIDEIVLIDQADCNHVTLFILVYMILTCVLHAWPNSQVQHS